MSLPCFSPGSTTFDDKTCILFEFRRSFDVLKLYLLDIPLITGLINGFLLVIGGGDKLVFSC
jgi:hypothetical protein